MAKRGFDLAALARQSLGDAAAVSELDTGRQLQYIQLDLLDPDTRNFYSTDGLEALAGNIEMNGLQQPLLVRPAEGGRYTVVSGHRRREALLLIRDGGGRSFEEGVPCIVDDSGGSEALQELRLIMANLDTRKMTSADQSRQAERIEDLLRQLVDEGYEFPGRLRDWVSELSGMSRTKLARLKVIRDKLDRPLFTRYYDKGKMPEDTAYELARLPVETQRRIVDWYVIRDLKNPRYWGASTIRKYAEDLARFATYTCPAKLGGKACCNQEQLQAAVWAPGYRNYCYCSHGSKCCATCTDIASCRNVCARMLEQAQAAKAQRRAANRAAKEAEAKADAPKAAKVRSIWLRFGNALANANMEDEDLRKRVKNIRMYQVKDEDLMKLEAGELEKVKGSMVLPFWNSFYLDEAERLVAIADALGCSLDYLLCRTDEPRPTSVSDPDAAPAKEWGTGKPPKPGMYAVRFKVSETAPGELHQFARWDGFNWHAVRSHKVISDMIAAYWSPLPEVD